MSSGDDKLEDVKVAQNVADASMNDSFEEPEESNDDGMLDDDSSSSYRV